MIAAHNCFPADWIGKKLVKSNDWTYYVDGDSSKQVSIPSGYGKPTSVRWLPNGVLRMDSDGGTKFFFVGYQRYFMAYGNETEPHDTIRYEEAVRECQRLREEETTRNSPRRNQDNIEERHSKTNDTKSSQSSAGSIIGGVGAMIGSARKAIKDYRSIDDTSFLDEVGKDIFDRQLNNMAEAERKSREESKKIDKFFERRDKELEKLRLFEQHYIHKEQKKRIFSNLHNLFSTEVIYVPDEVIFNMLGIFDPELKAAVVRAKKRYLKSVKEVTPSEKFYNYWAEVFYLIEEGYPLRDEHLEEFAKNIYNTCNPATLNGDNESKKVAPFYECLIPWYKKLNHAYWGHKFDKDPREDTVKERIYFLEHADYYNGDNLDQGYIDLEKLFPEFNIERDDDNDKKDNNNKQVESASPTSTERKKKKTVTSIQKANNGKYDDLDSIDFKKDNSNEELKEVKGMLDFSTKSKNKKIASKKEKWNEAMWNLDHKLKNKVLKRLTRIEEDVVKLLKLEEESDKLTASGHSTGFLGFGGSNELKKVKANIKSIKEKIVEHIEDLKESVDDLRDCEEDIKDLQDDLYELTELGKYANFKPLDGKGMSIATQLIKNKKDTDAQKLKSIFEL